jgi:lysophospholipase L1-like esterase
MAGASALQKRTAQARPDAASFAPGGVAGFATSGDSLTAAVLPNGAPNWPIILSIITDGAFRLIFDAGIGGYTTSQVLARFLAAVRQTKPAVCTIFSGANDVTGSYSGWQANIRAIVAACRASGIQPVLCTITPNSSAGADHPADRLLRGGDRPVDGELEDGPRL